MRNLEIDIETYSSVSLQKCGVYKYAESPDFEILLFGYSADGGEVRVIDLASGETLPADVLSALTDEYVSMSISRFLIPILHNENEAAEGETPCRPGSLTS